MITVWWMNDKTHPTESKGRVRNCLSDERQERDTYLDHWTGCDLVLGHYGVERRVHPARTGSWSLDHWYQPHLWLQTDTSYPWCTVTLLIMISWSSTNMSISLLFSWISLLSGSLARSSVWVKAWDIHRWRICWSVIINIISICATFNILSTSRNISDSNSDSYWISSSSSVWQSVESCPTLLWPSSWLSWGSKFRILSSFKIKSSTVNSVSIFKHQERGWSIWSIISCNIPWPLLIISRVTLQI